MTLCRDNNILLRNLHVYTATDLTSGVISTPSVIRYHKQRFVAGVCPVASVTRLPLLMPSGQTLLALNNF